MIVKGGIVKILPASCRGSKSRRISLEKTVTLPVVWLPEAQAELTEALEHYDTIRPELGERFANAVVETAEAIAVTPLRFALVDKGRRRAGVRWFP